MADTRLKTGLALHEAKETKQLATGRCRWVARWPERKQWMKERKETKGTPFITNTRQDKRDRANRIPISSSCRAILDIYSHFVQHVVKFHIIIKNRKKIDLSMIMELRFIFIGNLCIYKIFLYFFFTF